MSANPKDLVREAMLYDEIGHRREARQLLHYADCACPGAMEVKVATEKLARPANETLMKVEKVGCRLMDWLYMPVVIAGAVGTAYLLFKILIV